MRLYYSPGACSLASHIVLEETGLPFEAVRTPVFEGAHRTPEFRALNPRGFVPALEEDGRVLTENAAIMLYLAHRRPEAGLLPEEPEPLGRCLEWLSWQASTAHIAFAQHWRPERFADGEEERRVVVAGAGPRMRRGFRPRSSPGWRSTLTPRATSTASPTRCSWSSTGGAGGSTSRWARRRSRPGPRISSG